MSLINTAVGLLAISSPIGVLPVVARAAGGDISRVRRISRLAVLTFLSTLLAACWWGQALLDLFAITLDSFRVAGGLILLPIGLRLIEGMEVNHPDVMSDSGSLGVVPIGLPLLAGPAAISLVVADAPVSWQGRLALSGVITLLAAGDLRHSVGVHAPAPGPGGTPGKGDQSADGPASQRHRRSDAGGWSQGQLPRALWSRVNRQDAGAASLCVV